MKTNLQKLIAVSVLFPAFCLLTATVYGQNDIHTVAGNGAYGCSDGSGAATTAQLSIPAGIAVDNDGNIYFADLICNTIYKVNTAGTISIVVGTNAGLSFPCGIAIDASGNIYIADNGNDVIREVAATNHTQFGQTMTAGNMYSITSTVGELALPTGVAIDGSGNLYIADGGYGVAWEVNASTGDLTTIAGNCSLCDAGLSGVPATEVSFSSPTGVTADADGNIYIVDNGWGLISEVAATNHTQFGQSMTAGDIYVIVGNIDQDGNYSGDGEPAIDAGLNGPYFMALDGSGNVYIADAGNNVIRKVSASNNHISTFAGNGSGNYGGDGGPATSATLNNPIGVAVNSAGTIVYISDELNSVIREVRHPIIITSSNSAICAGDSASLGSDVSINGGKGALIYAWNPAAGLSDSTLANPWASPTATTTYSLTVTDSLSESATATVVLTVDSLPGDSVGISQSISGGSSTTIGGGSISGETYNWSPATGLSSSTASNPTASPTTTTTYTLTEAITATGCSLTDSVTITVNPPDNNAGSNQSICNGSSATIGAGSTSGHTYSWSPATGLSSSTVSSPTASPTVTTTYTLTETITATGFSWTDSVTVTVNSNPSANAGSNVAICSGSSTALGGSPAATSGTSPYTYSWNPATGLSSSTIANPTANPTTTSTYTLAVTDSNGCTGGANIIVIVNSLPGNNEGSNQTICSGGSPTIGAGGTSGHTYSWSPATGLSSSTASEPTASPTTTTTYTLTETTATGCSASNSVTVTVNPLPGNNEGSNQSICSGTSPTIGATSTTGHTYSWSPATGLSSSTTSNPTASPTTTTTYTLTETTAIGCSVSNSVTVTVNSLPGNNAGSNVTIYDSSSTTIGASSTSGHSYSWSPATGLSNSTISNPTASPTTTTTYTLTETITATGCSASNSVIVTVNPINYYWNVSSGNWSSAASWSTVGFGGAAASSPPTKGAYIYIGNGSANATITLTGNDTIGNLTLEGSGQLFINGSGYTLTVDNNIYDTNTGTTGGGSATIVMGGGGTQNIYGNSSGTEDVGKLPNLNIKSSGTVNLYGDITMGGSTTLTYTTGAVNAGTSDVIFYYNNTITGSWIFNNVEFQGTGSAFTISNTVTVNGNMTISETGQFNLDGSTIDLSGNLLITNNNAGGGTTVINLNGSGNQQINSSNTTEGHAFLPSVIISSRSSSDTVSLYGVISVQTAWTNNLPTSQINAGTAELCFYYPNNTTTIGGSYPTPIYNLSFGYSGAPSNATYSLGLDSALVVQHTLKFQGNQLCVVNNHSIAVYGNVAVSNGWGGSGSATLYFKGSSVDTLSSSLPVGGGGLPNVTVLKSGGSLLLSGTITVFGAWVNNFSNTNVIAGTSLVYIYSPNATNLIVGGTHSTTFYRLWLGGGSNCTYNFNRDTSIIVTDTLRMLSPDKNLIMNGDSILVTGQLINEGTGAPGSAVILLTGSNNQNISAPNGGWFPSITLRKGGGTLTLSGSIGVGTYWTNNDYSTSSINYGTATLTFGISNSTTYWGGRTPTPVYKLLLLNGNCVFNLTHDSAFIVEDTLFISSGYSSAYGITGDKLVVLGSIVNNHAWAPTISSIVFGGGSSNQTISGANGFTFTNMIINKSAGTLTLYQPIAISSSLTFNNGIINTTSTDLLTFNSGSTVSGASNSGYVNGPVAKTGNTAFTFPIGGTISGTNTYMPLGISAPTSSDTWTASYNYGSGSTSLYSLGTGVTYVDPCEYWLLTKSGSSSVKATLNWNNPCFHIASLSYVTAAYVNSGHTTWDSTGTYSTSNSTTTGSLTSKSHSLWDTVTIAKTNRLISITPTNTAICIGTSTSLGSDVTVTGGTGTLTYAWNPATGLSSTTAANPTASPTSTTTYSLTVTDAITESSSATVVITVNPAPGNNAGSNKAVCIGSGNSIGADSTSGHTYSWSPATALSSSTVSNPTGSPTTTTTYTLTETITVTGCSASNTVTVTLNILPIAHAGRDTDICLGNYINIGTLPAATSGLSPYSYSWSPAISLNSSTISQPLATPTTTTSYILTVTDYNGCTAKDTMVLIVNNYTLPVADAGPDYTICPGNGVVLGGAPTASSGTPPYQYIWTDSLGNIVSTNSNPGVNAASHYYSVLVTDSNLCFARDTAAIINTSQPIARAGRDTIVCYGSQVTLGASPSATGGQVPYTYSWFPSYYLSRFDTANPIATVLDNQQYILHIIDNTGCQSLDDTVNVTVKTMPIFNTGGSKYICSGGDTVTLGWDTLIKGGYPPFSYHWFPDYFINDTSSDRPHVYPPTDTVYFLIVRDSIGCLFNVPDSVTISIPKAHAGLAQTIVKGSSVLLGGVPTAYSGVAPISYLWNSSLVLDSTSANPIVHPDTSTNYSVKVTDYIGCVGYDTVLIKVTPHADSSFNAIVLNNPDSTVQFYTLVTTDSVTWFRFHSDSTHSVIMCQWVYGYSDFAFTQLSLFADSATNPICSAAADLRIINPRQISGIVTDSLQSDHEYYLRVRKFGDTECAISIIYTGYPPIPYEQAQELSSLNR